MFKKALNKLKTGTGDDQTNSQTIFSGAWNTPATRQQIYRYRKSRGVNLGSLFTLETWLTPSLFVGVKNAASEYDLCKQLGDQVAKERLEQHWNSFINDGDWHWMRSQGIRTVRLPISYYHFLPGHPNSNVQSLMKDTEYEKLAPIYRNAFACIRNIIEKASQYGIGVLVDLHAAPGCQNADGHSGLSGGKVNFYSSHNMCKTISILHAIVETYGPMENITGIELINEPQDNEKLASWYKDAIRILRKDTSHCNIPLYMGDCWNPAKYGEVLMSHQRSAGLLVLDHHLYRCFTAEDCATSSSQHIAQIAANQNGTGYNQLVQASSCMRKGLVIGEWSGALHPNSFKSDQPKAELQRRWARAQLDTFNAQCAGHFFWTLKKEGEADPGWCLYSAIEQDILPSGLGGPPVDLDLHYLEQRGKDEGEGSYNGHVAYWSQNSGGKQMHHNKYRDGFTQIYRDCLDFYQQGQDEIGFTGDWIGQRARAHSQEHGSDGEWEFLHGGEKAMECFLRTLWS